MDAGGQGTATVHAAALFRGLSGTQESGSLGSRLVDL